MLDLKEILMNYAAFLNASWNTVELISKNDTTGSMKIDWLQANWEILVEGALHEQKIKLEIYGEGADCNGASSRVLFPDLLPTHKILCVPIEGNEIYDVLNKKHIDTLSGHIIFDYFVSFQTNGWYYEKPKFDHILANYNGNEVVIDFEATEFKLQEISLPLN